MEQIKEPAMHSRGTKILGLCFSLCVTLVVSVSCRSDRSDTGWMNQSFDFASEIPATTRDSATYIMQQSLQHNSKFQTFASNIEAKMKVGAFKIGMGGQVRIAEDSVLWAIVHKMGMELVRLKLTPDSLFMCSKVANMAAIYTDRQNHEMMAGFYRICQNLLMRQMDTSLFQNPASLVLNKNKAWEIKGLSDDSVAWTTWIDARSFKILQFDVALQDEGSEMQASFKYLADNLMDIRLAQDRKELIRVEIGYANPQWNIPLSFPLQIPAYNTVSVNHGLIKSMQKVENEFIRPE